MVLRKRSKSTLTTQIQYKYQSQRPHPLEPSFTIPMIKRSSKTLSYAARIGSSEKLEVSHFIRNSTCLIRNTNRSQKSESRRTLSKIPTGQHRVLISALSPRHQIKPDLAILELYQQYKSQTSRCRTIS